MVLIVVLVDNEGSQGLAAATVAHRDAILERAEANPELSGALAPLVEVLPLFAARRKTRTSAAKEPCPT